MFYTTVEMAFKWLFLSELLRAIFRTEPKVQGRALLQK